MQPTKTKAEMKLSNYLALMAAVTVVVILIGGLAAKALGSSFLLNQKVINKKALAARTLQTDVGAAKSVADQYVALGGGATMISDALPTGPDLPGLANAVEQMANLSGALLKDVSTSGDTAGTAATATSTPAAGGSASLQTLPVSLSVSVAYPNLTRFLAALESSARPVRVNSIQLAGTNASLVVQLEATTYYQPAAGFTVTKEAVK